MTVGCNRQFTPQKWERLRLESEFAKSFPGVSIDDVQPPLSRTNAIEGHPSGKLGELCLTLVPVLWTDDLWWFSAIRLRNGVQEFQKRPVCGHGCVMFVGTYAREFIGTKWNWTETDAGPSKTLPWTRTQTPRVSDVYFIQPETGGPIKIGLSNCVKSRLAEIQLMSPFRLKIIGRIQCGGFALESELHERFSHLRLHGEWFRAEPDLLRFIDSEAID